MAWCAIAWMIWKLSLPAAWSSRYHPLRGSSWKQGWIMKKQRKRKSSSGASGLPEYARKIHQARQHCGMDQKEFADMLAVGPSVISSWELGKYPPSAERYALLGNLVHPVGDALWFWEQAGIDRKRLLSAAAHIMMESGIELKPSSLNAKEAEEAKAFLEELEIHRHEIGGESHASIGSAEVSISTAMRLTGLLAPKLQELAKSGKLRARRVTPRGAYIYEFGSLLEYKKRPHGLHSNKQGEKEEKK